MRLLHLSLLSGLMVMSTMTMSAADVEMSITPPEGDYETLPSEFTITVAGAEKLNRNMFGGGNPVVITPPSGGDNGTSVPTYSGDHMVYKVPAAVALDESGEYTITVKAKRLDMWFGGVKQTTTEDYVFTYNVKGSGGDEPEPGPVEPQPVVYDIELQKTTPNLTPLDLQEYDTTNNILMLYFNMGHLELGSGATVTISGPEYDKTLTMKLGMVTDSSTAFKVTDFEAPKYSGKYTITIPQGVMGDEEWIKDPHFGHSNKAITYDFEVINGLSTEHATVAISPLPGEYDTLPESFVITVDGPKSIMKNTGVGGNPLLIISPKGTRNQVPGEFSGNTITFNVPAGFPLDEKGDYTVQFKEKTITYLWADGSKSYSDPEEYVYNVKGKDDEEPQGPTDVVYDIEAVKYIPTLTPFDIDMRDLETLQIYFNMGDLQLDPDADAVVTITGPNFYGIATLSLGMNMPTATVFKAPFKQPKYDGEYTLTIPQGILGDKDWINDHNYGHANAEVVYTFTAVNGEDPSTITKDLTFNPHVTPGVGAKVTDLPKVTLAFTSKPYWNPETEIEVTYRNDLSEQGVDVLFGTARLAAGEGNDLILTITPTPRTTGQYSLTLPEGVIWNEAHEADKDNEKAGAFNDEMDLSWFLSAGTITDVEVTGNVPATNSYVGSFPVGKECIVIMTNRPEEVASADIELIEYKLEDDSVAPKTVLNITTTTINKDGYICWVNNEGGDIELLSGYYYEVVYTLKDADGNALTDGSFEFYGDMSTGIVGIEDEDGVRRVFNMQGFEMKDENLPAGLYIVNGKKIVIRK
ncbi:MAG: hypothetical protein K2O24_00615 [Muribaculaceae bacterium]|nr:hypothetical protein [Muribaculaceae bacterium]